MKKSSERDYAEVIDDATITATIKSILIWRNHTNGLGTDVNTESGKVTLKGAVDNEASKDLAKNLARNTRGVVSVDNQLVVVTKPSPAINAKSGKHETVQGIDRCIMTKVKAQPICSTEMWMVAISQ